MFSPKKFLNSTIIGLTLGILLAGYAVFAFTPPTVAPPGGNTEAPVNVGAEDQIKNSGLWVGGLGVQGGLKLGIFGTLPTDIDCVSDRNKIGEIIYHTGTDKPYICDGATWSEFRGLQGAQGSQGLQGPKGPKGDPGDKNF